MSGAALTIGDQSELRFGYEKSWFTIMIANNNTSSDTSLVLYLTLPPAFVTHVDDIEFLLADTNDSVPTEIDPTGAQTTWKIGGGRGIAVPAGGKTILKLASINAAGAGGFALPVRWIESGKEASDSLQVTVQSGEDWPTIVTFAAENEVFDPNSGAKITLHWEVENADTVVLFRGKTKVLPAPNSGEETAPGKGQWSDPTSDRITDMQDYRLKASKSKKEVSDLVLVRIQNPGWNRIPRCDEGSPVAMMNDHDERLYGVFLKGGMASLYLLNPSQGALGTGDRFLKQVPRGLETSPGAFFDQKIWIVGGSQIDPNACSNLVWWFDPLTKESGSSQASWKPRMGHACLAFDNALWILGGADAAGNTLSEVYRSTDGANWTPVTNQAPALVMAGATVYRDKLWLCGGTADVFGAPQKLLWFLNPGNDPSWKDATWTKLSFFGGSGQSFFELPYGDPFALALSPGKLRNAEVLCGFGTFQAQPAGTGSGEFMVKGIKDGATPAELQMGDPIPQSKLWATTVGGGDLTQPFRLTAMQFHSFIFAFSQVYGLNSTSLSYLVQDTTSQGARR